MSTRLRPSIPGAQARATRRAEPKPAATSETGNTEALSSEGLSSEGYSVVRSKGPYAALAARGSFEGFVTLPSGEDVFVRIRPGKNPTNWPPIVYLDGLNGCVSRSEKLDALTSTHGHTLVSIGLRGQGETLVRDLAKTKGQSVADDIDPKDQVKLLEDTLDTLGVKAPVHLMGLSYGGGIAALAKRTHPERFQKLLLVAPYTRSMSQHDPMRVMFHAAMQHPWNPFGTMVYRTLTESAVSLGLPPPEAFKTFEEREAFRKGAARLTLGMEAFDLEPTVTGLENVHILSMPFDPISPPGFARMAYDKAKSGSFTTADVFRDAGKHDLIDLDPALMTRWAQSVMRDERKGVGTVGRPKVPD